MPQKKKPRKGAGPRSRSASPVKKGGRGKKKNLSEAEQKEADQRAALDDEERVRLSRLADERAVADAKRRAEEESSKRFTDLKAFEGVGVRELFDYSFVHPSGIRVQRFACNCPFCIRGYRPDGFWTSTKGCLMGEPTNLIICERTDKQ
jgi:hypothetical protein